MWRIDWCCTYGPGSVTIVTATERHGAGEIANIVGIATVAYDNQGLKGL